MVKKTITYEYLKGIFISKGHALLTTKDEFEKNKKLLTFICGNCNSTSTVSKITQKSNKGCCKHCYQKASGKSQSLSHEEVYQYFKNQECELLEKEYKNNRTKMKYRCSCGNISYISFSNFKQGQRCSKCRKGVRLSYTEVYQYFKDGGCELLEKKYINSSIKMKYRCSCGEISYINFHNFKTNKQRCSNCKMERIRKKQLESGNWKSEEEMNDYRIYLLTVRKLTRKTYIKNKHIINPKNLPRGRKKYHLDHKFSISEGFKNNIPPYIISSVNNLTLILEFENHSKNKESSITLKELFEGYEDSFNFKL